MIDLFLGIFRVLTHVASAETETETLACKRAAAPGAGVEADAGVADPIAGAVLDAVIPGLGTALGIAQVAADVAAPGAGTEKVEFPLATDDEAKNEIEMDR